MGKIKVQIALIQVGQFITTRNKEQWYFVNGDYTLDKMLRCQHSHCYTLESDSDQVKQGCLKQSDKKISLQQNRRYMIMSFSKILKQLTRMERSFATQHKPQMTGLVLAYDRFFVVARHVVPLDSVSIEVIEDGHASFLLSTLPMFPVVRLSNPVPSSMRPVIELVAVSRGHFHLVGRPEPSVDQLWEELGLVTTVKIALATGRPEKGHPAINEALHPVVLLARLKGNQVHAPFPAVVPCVEPVPLGVANLCILVQPAEVIVVSPKALDPKQVCSLSTELRVAKAEFPFSVVLASAIVREQLVLPSCSEFCVGARSKSEDVPEPVVDRPEEVVDRLDEEIAE